MDRKKYKDGWMDIKNVWIKRKMDGWLDGWINKQKDGWKENKNMK